MTGGALQSALLTAGVNLLVLGIVGWLVRWPIERWVRRRDEMVDALQAQVSSLANVRLVGIEAQIRDHAALDDVRHNAAAASRKDLHKGFARVENEKVDWAQCNNRHADYTAQVAELARVSERVAVASKECGHLLDRLISTKGDVDRLIGRVEALEKGRTK